MLKEVYQKIIYLLALHAVNVALTLWLPRSKMIRSDHFKKTSWFRENTASITFSSSITCKITVWWLITKSFHYKDNINTGCWHINNCNSIDLAKSKSIFFKLPVCKVLINQMEKSHSHVFHYKCLIQTFQPAFDKSGT